jgi:hypothetical protein
MILFAPKQPQNSLQKFPEIAQRIRRVRGDIIIIVSLQSGGGPRIRSVAGRDLGPGGHPLRSRSASGTYFLPHGALCE